MMYQHTYSGEVRAEPHPGVLRGARERPAAAGGGQRRPAERGAVLPALKFWLIRGYGEGGKEGRWDMRVVRGILNAIWRRRRGM